MKRLATACAAFALVLAGCASVPAERVAEGAPITYKIGQGAMSHAAAPRVVSLQKPEPEARRFATAPDLPRHLPRLEDVTPEQPTFDKDDVDTELYAHQRVGKRYKVFGKSYTPRHEPNYDETGIASWYGPKFHGRPTALGEPFDMNGMTAAHKTLPLNSLVHVTNLSTGKSLTLRVNDRGPFVDGRIIDLSKGAAIELGLLEHGLKEVRVQYAGPADPNDLDGVVSRMVADDREPVQIAPAPAEPRNESVAEDKTYTPLRSLGNVERSAEAKPYVPVLPKPQVLVPSYPAAPAAPEFTPLQDVQPDDHEGPLTLTIKGPIHLAKSSRFQHPEHIIAAAHD